MKQKILILLFCLNCINISCKKFLDIGVPKDSLVQATVFDSNEIATSALIGIYSSMANNSYASGNSSSITALCGLSADELINFNSAYSQFYENNLTSSNSAITTLYGTPYNMIYAANAVIEGLSKSVNVTPSVKGQLEGEALFIRAFNYFYLVNLFGRVPLNLSTDYKVNQNAIRSSIEIIYQQIINDLIASEKLLGDAYITTERIRPNKSVVQSLLSRVYLYLNDWENAEKYAYLVISKTNSYSLASLDAVFLKNSSETIWQLMPPSNNYNTFEGGMFILTSTPQIVSLNKDFVENAFEANDKRKNSWIKTFTDNTGIYYYPFKYKVKQSTTITEYSMILRLAELYLIRSEARAHLNKLSTAISDLDEIRNRAGLPLIKDVSPNISQADLILKIQSERRIELFAEWGHRWFDLKRKKTADVVLSTIKPAWKSTSVLYPIPDEEINRNRNITQNEGY